MASRLTGKGSNARRNPAAFGAIVAEVPPPLAIGSVTVPDGSHGKGIACEPSGCDGALDITHHGGWLAFLRTLA